MTNVVFIHGLWVAHTSWQPWIERFAQEGYSSIAPRWPGEAETTEETRGNPSAQAGFGLDQITDHFASALEQFDSPPIAIGHSFGGLIAQKLLGQNKVAAAVAIDPAPMQGVRALPLAQLRSAFPVLGNPLNHGRAKGLTKGQWRYGFGNALTEVESDALWEQWAIPSPAKPLFQVGTANFALHSPAKVDTVNTSRGPLLITGGTEDHTVPMVTARGAYKRYAKSPAVTDFHEFSGKGHSLIIDHGWQEVADTALTWLKAQNLAG
jgi:alpha-beta hydrolase superfamily lysophospholipase